MYGVAVAGWNFDVRSDVACSLGGCLFACSWRRLFPRPGVVRGAGCAQPPCGLRWRSFVERVYDLSYPFAGRRQNRSLGGAIADDEVLSALCEIHRKQMSTR